MNVDQLWSNYKPGNQKIRNQLIEHYYPLVERVAQKTARGLPKSVSVDDLVGYGSFGLIGAIDRFEPDRGFKFETYAARRIHGAILDGLREYDWVPRSVRSKAKEIDRTAQVLEHRLGRHPTAAEIAQELGVEEEYVSSTITDVEFGNLETIESYDQEDSENSLSYGMALASPGDASQYLELEVIVDSLGEAIESMDEREKMVLHMVYWEDMPMADIGVVLGVTESRVCQILTKANSYLKDRLDAKVS